MVSARKKTTLNFEQALDKIQQIVESMESGELTLEQSLEAFEQGINLTRTAQQTLSQAQQKVDKLIEKNGQFNLTPFSTDGNND